MKNLIRRILKEEFETKSTNVEFDKYKDSKFNSLRKYTLQNIVDNWDKVKNDKNENIKTIKYFIDNPNKITDLVYDDKGLEDGYHRLIAAKILKKPTFSFTLKEKITEARVPREERVQLYKDENIIVVVPLTHKALQKYAHQCQWCINDDKSEWEGYHQGRHAVIIQRKPKELRIGITGNPTASEILVLERWDSGYYDATSVREILNYEFKDKKEMVDYYITISNDINNFATNIVYYSPENGLYDMEDNYLWNHNIEINDIPNVTPKVIEIIDDYLYDK